MPTHRLIQPKNILWTHRMITARMALAFVEKSLFLWCNTAVLRLIMPLFLSLKAIGFAA